MEKIPPVSRRKTITAWVSVGVFTIVLIGVSLFLQNSNLFKANANIGDNIGRLGGPVKIDTRLSEGTGTIGTGSTDTSAPTTCADDPTGSGCQQALAQGCGNAVSTINEDFYAKTGQNLSTDYKKSISQIDAQVVAGNVDETTAETWKAILSESCSEVVSEFDSCVDAYSQLETLSKDQTVPELQTALVELQSQNKTPSEIANTLRFYTTDDAGLITYTEYPLQSDEMLDIADSFDKCEKTLTDATGEETTAFGGGQEGAGGTSIGGISFDNLSTWGKILAALEILNNIFQGNSLYESVMLAAAAGFIDSDQIYKLAAAAALIDDNPELAASLITADALGYDDLLANTSSSAFDQVGQNSSTPWNYIQNRTAEMASELYKISALQGIASSLGELIANFMGEEQGQAFLEKWDGTVNSLADLASGLLTYEYADVATYGGYSSGGYYGLSPYLTGGSNVAGSNYYYNPQGATTTQYSSDLSSLIANQISASVTGSTEKNTANIILTGYTEPLISQIVNLGSIIIPTSRGVYIAEIGSLFLNGNNTETTTE